jgi:hypothetical protein
MLGLEQRDKLPWYVDHMLGRVEELIVKKTKNIGLSRETVALAIAAGEMLEMISPPKKSTGSSEDSEKTLKAVEKGKKNG